ncbi:MAG TPA: BMC domain-containing protein [Halanaerobiales bacterium]|nr:BMC domain-containing protein [Halanaerobiales bacterium]
MRALGLIEIMGLATAFTALDTMLKTANLNYLGCKKKLGNGLVTVIVEGDPSSINYALSNAKTIIDNENKIITADSILNPHQEILDLLDKTESDNKNPDNNNLNKKLNYNNLNNSKDHKALGLIEIYGFVATLIAADTALKAADIHILKMDKTKGNRSNTPGLIMFLQFTGTVADVKLGIETAGKRASDITGVISSSVIADPVI